MPAASIPVHPTGRPDPSVTNPGRELVAAREAADRLYGTVLGVLELLREGRPLEALARLDRATVQVGEVARLCHRAHGGAGASRTQSVGTAGTRDGSRPEVQGQRPPRPRDASDPVVLLGPGGDFTKSLSLLPLNRGMDRDAGLGLNLQA